MLTGFIGQELSETPSPGSPSPTTTTTTTTTTSPQQPPATPPSADTRSDQASASTTYVPLEKVVSEVDAVHNTLLVGLLIAFVAASVALGCLTIYCLRRRAQKKLQRTYQAELRGIQRKDDEERAARGA